MGALRNAMRGKNWLVIVGLLVVGAIVGAGGIIASVAVNRYTSGDAFCTSCHSMALVASDPHYVHSAHHANAEGVRVTCGACHIPATNWFVETYTHAADGIRDAFAEATHDYGNPAVWAARRVELAHEVRDEMRREDSVTCRSCHEAAVIEPTSEAGQAAHALMREKHLTCIDCHINLIHAPVPPRMSFIRGSGLGGPAVP